MPEVEEAQTFDRFQRSLRSVPHFSNEGSSTWRSHELAFRTWAAVNNLSSYSNHRRKLALLLSLVGGATRAVELYGLGTVGFGSENDQGENVVAYEDYFKLIKSVFVPKSESNLGRLEFEQRTQHPAEPPAEYTIEKISLYHQAEPEKSRRSF